MSVALVNSHVLLPHLPDWGGSVALSRLWQTEVGRAVDGSESRLAPRNSPRQKLGWSIVPCDAGEQALLHARLRAARKSGYAAVPFWGRGIKVASSAGADLTLDGDPWSFLAADDYVLVRGLDVTDPEAFEIAQVDSISGSVLTMKASLSDSWGSAHFCWPILFGVFSCGDLTHRSDWHTPVACELLTLAAPPLISGPVELITDGDGEFETWNDFGGWASDTANPADAADGWFFNDGGVRAHTPVASGFGVNPQIAGASDLMSDHSVRDNALFLYRTIAIPAGTYTWAHATWRDLARVNHISGLGTYKLQTQAFLCTTEEQPALTFDMDYAAAWITKRNDFTGYVGVWIRPEHSLRLSHLGRYCASASSGVHTLYVVEKDDTSVVLGQVDIDASNGVVGEFQYGALATPIQLIADESYLLLSSETSGGDEWWDSFISGTYSGGPPAYYDYTVQESLRLFWGYTMYGALVNPDWTINVIQTYGASYGPLNFTIQHDYTPLVELNTYGFTSDYEDPAPYEWNEDVLSVINANAGQDIIWKFVVRAINGFFNLQVDNVSLKVQ